MIRSTHEPGRPAWRVCRLSGNLAVYALAACEEGRAMAFERLMAQISLLVGEMENRPEDKHELYLQLREKLNELRSLGHRVPDDLLQLEKTLEEEFAADLGR
jgi:hypothetical protein